MPTEVIIAIAAVAIGALFASVGSLVGNYVLARRTSRHMERVLEQARRMLRALEAAPALSPEQREQRRQEILEGARLQIELAYRDPKGRIKTLRLDPADERSIGEFVDTIETTRVPHGAVRGPTASIR